MQTRREIMNDKLKVRNKRLFTKLNMGVALLGAGAVLAQVNADNPNTIVYAASQRNTPHQFLGLISDSASRIAKDNDLYASVMIAQAALESGWGNSGLAQAPNYNLFGIKGEYNGNSTTVDTLEDDGTGNYYQIQAGFRQYDNYSQSLQDYANVLTGDNDPNNWRYKFYEGARLSSANTYQDATAHLTGRYATDTSYGTKLNNIIQTYNLTQYDSRGSTVSVPNNSNSGSTSGYTVQAGDSLYAIARKHGISINDLLASSGLSLDTVIHPGQVIAVNAASTTPQAGTTPVAPESNTTTSNNGTSQSSSGNASGVYVVKAGDGLYRIATQHGMSVAQLRTLNGISGDLIHPGQQLRVSGSVSQPSTTEQESTPVEVPETPTASTPVSKPVTPTTPSSSSGTYVVKRGDGLYRIATNHGLSLSQLKALNGLTGNLIHPGQVLNVSGTPVAKEVYTSSQSVDVEVVQETSPVVENQSSVAESQTPVVDSQASTASVTHTIQAGDTLYSISRRYGVNVHNLIARYGQIIHPGQVIIIK